jgi:hypothetical protein
MKVTVDKPVTERLLGNMQNMQRSRNFNSVLLAAMQDKPGDNNPTHDTVHDFVFKT